MNLNMDRKVLIELTETDLLVLRLALCHARVVMLKKGNLEDYHKFSNLLEKLERNEKKVEA